MTVIITDIETGAVTAISRGRRVGFSAYMAAAGAGMAAAALAATSAGGAVAHLSRTLSFAQHQAARHDALRQRRKAQRAARKQTRRRA